MLVLAHNLREQLRDAVGAQWGKVHCNIKMQFTEDEGRNLSFSLLRQLRFREDNRDRRRCTATA